jgi:hypothetical protein
MGRWFEQPFPEAVSSAQLIPCTWFDPLFGLDEWSSLLRPSAFAVRVAQNARGCCLPSIEESVCRKQHAISSDFILLG